MYDELVKELRDSAEWADRLALLMGRAEGDVHAPAMRKAADAIEELVGFVQEAERDRDEYRERLDKANDAIEELQRCLDGVCADNDSLCKRIDELNKPRWIPVTDRLPEPETDVLSFRIYGSFSQMSEVTINDMKKNGEWCYEGVTHWMSFPEPPKEES